MMGWQRWHGDGDSGHPVSDVAVAGKVGPDPGFAGGTCGRLLLLERCSVSLTAMPRWPIVVVVADRDSGQMLKKLLDGLGTAVALWRLVGLVHADEGDSR